MEIFFRYYFPAVVLFSVFSAIICNIYAHLIFRLMAAKYPDQYKPLYRHRWRSLSPIKFHRRFTSTIKALGDQKLNSLLAGYTFWLICAISVFFTFTAGKLLHLILLYAST